MRWFALVLVLMLALCTTACAQPEQLTMYPAADPGYQRMLIHLPAVDNEQDYEVELQVGKMLAIDCNSYFFTGKMERKIINGWGYPYEVVSDIKGPMSTRMACSPGESEKEGFVPLLLDEVKRRYNSKLPLVIYVPDGFEVRYRLWTVTGPSRAANVE
ncbi:MAG: serine protease inhibitor ecotin [Desulfuromonas sp.]|nr:serine protease inhibitor ecotin [Desulfuromonas sp.]